MLRYYKERLASCVRSFAVIVSEGHNIDRADFEFVVEFYATCVVGIIEQWLDAGMQAPAIVTMDRCMRLLDNSVENMLFRFQN